MFNGGLICEVGRKGPVYGHAQIGTREDVEGDRGEKKISSAKKYT